VVASWSGGKDSALALQSVLADESLRVEALVTTVTAGYDRVSMHGVRRELLERQAAALGIPLAVATIPARASNESYEAAQRAALAPFRARGVRRVVCGDLFLADIRDYRDRLYATVGMEGLYPVWGADTHALAERFIDAGFRAILACVDPQQIDAGFAGRDFDRRLLAELPPTADPCGERGEFHTFVHDGPIFHAPVPVRRGEVVERDGFVFQDLLC
jgi:uncharacterized protein (TIGR00290 family)